MTTELLGTIQQAWRVTLNKFRRNKEEIVARYSADRDPTPPVIQPLRPRFSHATGDDDFGVGSDNCFDTYHRRQGIEMTKNILSAAQPDNAGDDLFATDGRQRGCFQIW